MSVLSDPHDVYAYVSQTEKPDSVAAAPATTEASAAESSEAPATETKDAPEILGVGTAEPAVAEAPVAEASTSAPVVAESEAVKET